MNIKEHNKNFNRRWNVTLSDTPEETFKKFKQRILTAFKHVENKLTSESVTKFCLYYAIDEKWENIGSTHLSKNIINQLEKENTLIEICRSVEIILSLKFQSYTELYSSRDFNYRSEIIENVKEAVEISDVNIAIEQSKNGIILYPKGEEKLDEELVNKTLSFLNENSNKHFMVQLFGVKSHTITYHLKEVFNSGELREQSVARKIRVTASDGKSYNTLFYNLDAIISVGYRVNSTCATQFRQWATHILREFAIKGYVLDKKRMENGNFINEDYFEHLLAEIREIRLSERRFYQKITDIYSTSIDYNRLAPMTQEFFAKVQNKLHYAIHGQTVAELIKKRASSKKKDMGLSSWENSPTGKILKTDVVIAKNYLTQKELES